MPNNLEKLIDSFAHGTIQEKYSSLRELIAMRKHHIAANDKRTQTGIDCLIESAGNTNLPDVERLLSVATLGRLASTIKKLRAPIYKSLKEPFANILPEPSLLPEPDDRSYIGFACEKISPQWGIVYCARAAVYEETGEQSRLAFLKALLTIEPKLDEALKILRETILNFIPKTEDPGSSMAKRLKRLTTALKIAISETNIDTGEDPGKQFYETCKAAFLNVPSPKKEESLYEAADGIGLVIHEMVRLRFSLATEASTYSAFRVIKQICQEFSWGKFASQSLIMRQVVQDIKEAVLILAKQGIADESLASELVVVSGDSSYAKQIMKELAMHPGLSAKIKNWLSEGRNEAPIVSNLGESQKLTEDGHFADLLVDSFRFIEMENIFRLQILPEIEMINPSLIEGTRRLQRSGLALCDVIQTMARRKRLQVRGNPGEEVDYSPTEHEVISNGIGTRRVRIIRPPVDQIRENGVSFVIRKGLVEKIK